MIGRKKILREMITGISCCLLLAGCDIPSLKELQEGVQSVKKQNQQIAQLEAKVAELERIVNSTQLDYTGILIRVHSLEQAKYQSAAFDPADTTFQRIDTDLGSFAVMIRDVKPLADGSRIKCLIGNLTSASVSGVSIKTKYGSRGPDKVAGWSGYLEWQKSLREREFKPNDALRPGTWNTIYLNLPGLAPEKLGYLELSMGAETLLLREDKK